MAFGLDAAAIAAILAAVGSVAGAGTGIASAAGAFDKGGGQPKMPSVPSVDPSQLQKGMIPGLKADTAARTGGGITEGFLEPLLAQQSGSPVGMDVLGDIRKQLGGGA